MTEVTNLTFGDSTAMYIGIAIVLVLIVIAIVAMMLANYKHRSNSETWYRDQVYAFKAGYIQKTATEKGIEMVYPPKADLMNTLEEEVSGDLSTP